MSLDVEGAFERELERTWTQLEGPAPSPVEGLLEQFDARRASSSSWAGALGALGVLGLVALTWALPAPRAARELERGGLERGGALIEALESVGEVPLW